MNNQIFGVNPEYDTPLMARTFLRAAGALRFGDALQILAVRLVELESSLIGLELECDECDDTGTEGGYCDDCGKACEYCDGARPCRTCRGDGYYIVTREHIERLSRKQLLIMLANAQRMAA